MMQEEKKKDHVLVTDGIYQYDSVNFAFRHTEHDAYRSNFRYLRHPSYFGWFWWSVSMAVLLANPITIVAFIYASWHFFADRIPYEEWLRPSN